MINNKQKKGKSVLAISQVIILLIGIIAFSYAAGSSLGFVSAKDDVKAPEEVSSNYNPKYFSSSILGNGVGLGNTYLNYKTYQKAAQAEARTKLAGEAIKEGAEKVPKKPGFLKGLWKKLFPEKAKWPTLKQAAADAVIALAIYYGTEFIFNKLGASKTGADEAGKSLAVAYIGYKALLSLGATNPAAAIVVIAILIIAAFTLKNQEKKAVIYQCLPWQAPLGGDDCEKCNNQGIIPCTEYMCHSLGQGCQFEEGLCVHVDQNDIIPPIMRPWVDALEFDYRYSNPNAVSPPDSGVEVIYKNDENGCAPAFTKISFGVALDEPGRCKLDFERKPIGQGKTIEDVFKSMLSYMDNSNMRAYNHSHTVRFPGSTHLSAENSSLDNGGKYEAYVRCQDSEGNINTMEFAFQFCVQEGPDTDEPEIVGTDWLNGAPIPYDLKEVNIEVYVNEPAECKWSHNDKSYDEMENQMTCPNSVTEQNAQMLYTCDVKLDGLQNLVENKFYFKCKDQPINVEEKLRNTNEESYVFTLIGTRPLIIDKVKPNGTIRGSTTPIKITLEAKTSAGWNEGEATCYYSDTGEEGSYFNFYTTGEHEHSTDLWLSEGEYKYFIRCMDLGGNFAIEELNFTVEIDLQAPIIVRVYHEGNYLKIITDENATCAYNTQETIACNYLFEDGISIAVVDETDHFTDWKTDKNFYIKCQDAYGNRPSPNECSMIVRPFELYSTLDEE